MNKLLLTGGSNKGKSELFRQMEFFEVSSSTFKSGLDGSRGWGKDQVESLGRCGLLLIDDIDHTPGLEFKSLTDTISLRVHYRGNPALPLKFLAMTSTHNAIFDGAGEEIINRVLHMSLGDDFIFDDSIMWKNDPDAYRANTVKYIRNIMMQTLKESSTRAELSRLQEKYRMSSDNALGEIIVKTIEETYSALDFDEGYNQGSKLHRMIADAGKYTGEMFIPNMTEIRGFIRERLKENAKGTTIDFNKYVNDILGSIVGDSRVRVGGYLGYPILSASENRLLLKYTPDDK